MTVVYLCLEQILKQNITILLLHRPNIINMKHPFETQKIVAVIFPFDASIPNFLGGGECRCLNCIDCCFFPCDNNEARLRPQSQHENKNPLNHLLIHLANIFSMSKFLVPNGPKIQTSKAFRARLFVHCLSKCSWPRQFAWF